MESKQLMASLTANLKNSLNRKQKIVFNENKLDSHILLRDLLIGEIYVERFRFACEDISLQIFQELSKSIE